VHTIHWQKSTYSGDGSNCVYVAAPAPDTINLRESDEPEITLTTTRERMSALIRTLKNNPPRHSA